VRAAVLLLAGAACVPKGRYELAEVQLAATRAALSARTGECAQDASAAEARVRELVGEIARRQLQLDELHARAALRNARLDRTQAREVVLLAELEALRAERDALRAAWPKKAPPPPPGPVPTPEADVARQEATRDLQEHFHEDLERQRAADARQADAAAFGSLVAAGHATVLARGDSTVVRIPTALLFQEGFSTLSARGRQLADEVAAALRQVPGRRVTIEGHTDDRPVHTAEYPSNWERGFGQAMALLHALEDARAPAALSAASFAGTAPLGPDEEANRRLELVIALDPELATAFPPTAP
jgi:flagellar motor protein MotB